MWGERPEQDGACTRCEYSRYEVPAGPLSPSVPLAATYTDYARGLDVVLDWIGVKEGVVPLPPQ